MTGRRVAAYIADRARETGARWAAAGRDRGRLETGLALRPSAYDRVVAQAETRKDHRQALIEGAIECLRTKGYGRTTARDIVAAADSHLPSINYYFGSKEKLLGEAISELVRRWTEQLIELLGEVEERDPWELLRIVAIDAARTFSEHRHIVAAFIESLAQANRSQDLRAQIADSYQELRLANRDLAEKLRAGEDRGPGAATEGAGSILMALADGLMIQLFLDPERTPKPEALVGGVRFLFGTGGE